MLQPRGWCFQTWNEKSGEIFLVHVDSSMNSKDVECRSELTSFKFHGTKMS